MVWGSREPLKQRSGVLILDALFHKTNVYPLNKRKGAAATTSTDSTHCAPLAKPPAASNIIDFAADAVRLVSKEVNCLEHWKSLGKRPEDRHIYLAFAHTINRLYTCCVVQARCVNLKEEYF